MEGAAAAADELCCTFILLFTFLRSELTAPLKKQGFLDSYGMRLLKCIVSLANELAGLLTDSLQSHCESYLCSALCIFFAIFELTTFVFAPCIEHLQTEFFSMCKNTFSQLKCSPAA